MNEEKFQVAVKAIINVENSYLLLFKSESEDVSPSEWDIPGGRVKFGEDLKMALKREINEETGIEVANDNFFPVKAWSIKKTEFQLVGIDFLCILKTKAKIEVSAEHTKGEWFEANDILQNSNIPSWLKEDIEKAEKIKGMLI